LHFQAPTGRHEIAQGAAPKAQTLGKLYKNKIRLALQGRPSFLAWQAEGPPLHGLVDKKKLFVIYHTQGLP
jgi:hypothetical protein